jgi:hypothetical protein
MVFQSQHSLAESNLESSTDRICSLTNFETRVTCGIH